MSSILLSRLYNTSFLDRLLTGDEEWILYSNVTRKRQRLLSPFQNLLPTIKESLHPILIIIIIMLQASIRFFVVIKEICDTKKNKNQVSKRLPNRKFLVFSKESSILGLDFLCKKNSPEGIHSPFPVLLRNGFLNKTIRRYIDKNTMKRDR